jgi:hypothetical protein
MSLERPSGTILAFLNEVAGGRTLLRTIRDRVENGAEHVAIAAPQNQPAAGQIVDAGELRDAALSRVEVTQRILHAFGIEATGAIFDPDPSLALDDSVRAFDPDEVLLSCLPESRFGWMRKDLVAWAERRFRVPIEHIPVRIEDDAIRWDVTHTLVVATRTVDAPDLVERLIERHEESPHRYTFVCPASGDIGREEICDKLAATMAELYRREIDATGQPMSPEPFAAVQNAIEHYRVDEVLISTLAGSSSQWLESGLIDRVKEITDKPIEHFEAGGGSRQPQTVSAGAGREAS